MSDQQRYRVVFSGVLTGEYDLDTTKRRFAKLFHQDVAKVEKLFTGKEFILKDDIEEDRAMTYAMKIAEAGCECYIEAVPDPNDISQQPGFVERRKNGERRQRFRRGPRPGAIIPDRRNNNGRRKADQKDKSA
ncbi:MAG: hypothetical protein WD356_00880 [Pseudomonadales bacterium]